jgi:hypothetical protein
VDTHEYEVTEASISTTNPIPKETSATMTIDTSTPDLRQIEEELTDIEDFLDEHAERVRQMQQDAEDLANGTEKDRWAAFLRLRRAFRRAATEGPAKAREGWGSFISGWKVTRYTMGLRRATMNFAGHFARKAGAALNDWLGLANIGALAISTARGRRILKAMARPVVWTHGKIAALLSKVPGGQKVNDKIFDAKEKAASKSKAWGLHGYFDVDSNAMARWRISAVLGIALKVGGKIGGRKVQVGIVIGHVVFADRTTGPKIRGWVKGLFKAAKNVKVTVDAPTTAETVAEAKVEADKASRRQRREEARKAAKAAKAEKAAETYEPSPEATEPGVPAA